MNGWYGRNAYFACLSLIPLPISVSHLKVGSTESVMPTEVLRYFSITTPLDNFTNNKSI